MQIKKKIIVFGMVVGACCLSFSVVAQDHSLVSGIPGYKLSEKKVVDFGKYNEDYIFNCGRNKCTEKDKGFDASGKFVAEGKVTTLKYSNLNKPSTTLEVYQNYLNAIKKINGNLVASVLPMGSSMQHESTNIFLVKKTNSVTWMILESAYEKNYKITIVEEKSMQQVVTAGELEDSIDKQGYATLYINFDNNQSVIKDEAKPSISEIVNLLNKYKEMRISVEGHTDNVGAATANKKLSQERASSVVNALVAAGIDKKRLQAKGVGSDAPIADNRTEEGRAKNRRVELVRLK